MKRKWRADLRRKATLVETVTTSLAGIDGAMIEAYRCKLCECDSIAKTHLIREMHFGTRETFQYVECAECASIQIAAPLTDLARFYPVHYYSLQPCPPPVRVSSLRDWMRRQRASHTLYGRNLFGALIKHLGRDDYVEYPPLEWFRGTGTTTASRILDVGCGSGELLRQLRQHGFNRLFGVDPFLSNTQEFDGLSLFAESVFGINGEFDLVMSHHSLEHMADPLAALERMRQLTARNGRMLIRIPLLDVPWKEYGINWVELDAPRHLFIPTLSGFEKLVARIRGLHIDNVTFDSTPLEFAASELYRMDIPLIDLSSGARSNIDIHFNEEQMRAFSERAAQLNSQRRAGRAAFYLRT